MKFVTHRDQQIVLDREHVPSLRDLGNTHGISHERVRQVVNDATEHVNRLELDLLVARKEGVAFGLAVPNQNQGDRAIALDYLQWVLARLRERDLLIEVTTKQTSEGLIVFLEDATNYRRS
jgi:hypothetical protein